MVCAHAHHEEARQEKRCGHCVSDGQQCERLGDDRDEIRQLGASVANHVADRVLHPRVCNQNPHRGEVRGERDDPNSRGVRFRREAFPAERPHRDERGFEEKCCGRLDCEQRSEYVADIRRIVRPVCTELEFERDAGDDADAEIEEEQFPPEARHPAIILIARARIFAFHQGDEYRQPQRKRHEEEMKDCSHGELQP